MNETNWKQAIPPGFPPLTRVWVYQSSRPFQEKELAEVTEQLYQFYAQWMSHNRPVSGWAGVLFNQMIVVMADDLADRLCGSAVDHSIRVMKSLERQYGVSLLDRMTLGFLAGGKVELLPMAQVPHALAMGKIDANTPFFNNAISTYAELDDRWLIPVRDSCLPGRFLCSVSS